MMTRYELIRIRDRYKFDQCERSGHDYKLLNVTATFGGWIIRGIKPRGDISRTAWECLKCKCFRVTVTDNSGVGRPQIVESMLKRCPLYYREMDYVERKIPDDDPDRGDHNE